MYGAGVEQTQLQEAMPAPQLQTSASLPATNPMQQPAPAAPMVQQQQASPDQYAQLIARAQEIKGQGGLLTAPTARPTEPVTAGLTRGPGVGPSALAA